MVTFKYELVSLHNIKHPADSHIKTKGVIFPQQSSLKKRCEEQKQLKAAKHNHVLFEKLNLLV